MTNELFELWLKRYLIYHGDLHLWPITAIFPAHPWLWVEKCAKVKEILSNNPWVTTFMNTEGLWGQRKPDFWIMTTKTEICICALDKIMCVSLYMAACLWKQRLGIKRNTVWIWIHLKLSREPSINISSLTVWLSFIIPFSPRGSRGRWDFYFYDAVSHI